MGIVRTSQVELPPTAAESGRSPLARKQAAFDKVFVPVLRELGRARIGQLADAARAKKVPREAVRSTRLWVASANQRGLVEINDTLTGGATTVELSPDHRN